VTSDSASQARHNADRVIDWERSAGMFTERSVQSWLLDLPGAIEFLNRYYVFVHFPVTIVFLVWVFARHRDRYPRIRNWFTGVTLAALVVHVLFPLAPPRMTDGFVDTLKVFGPNIYTDDTSKSVANQFAAMPSLHFGWALMVAVGVVWLTGRHRLLWMLHPVTTLLAIVATGNHYWIDAAVAGVLVAVVGWLVLRQRETKTIVVSIESPVSTPCSHAVASELHWPHHCGSSLESGHALVRRAAADEQPASSTGRPRCG
jgi:hypothetical protein